MVHAATFTCVRLRPDVLRRYLRMKGLDAEVSEIGRVYTEWLNSTMAAKMVYRLEDMAKSRGWDPTKQKLELFRETEQMRKDRRSKEKRTQMKWPFSYFLKSYHKEYGLF